MNRQERIDALRKALAAVNAAIATTQAALARATDGDEIQQLTSVLTDLQVERQSLGFQLANLEMAAGEIGEIAPEAAARVRALSADLDAIVVRRATFGAAVDFATAVLGKVSDLRGAVG